jgi:probable F420-dependent oxidoreductase
MQYGFVFPQYEIEDDPSAIRDLVQTAEGLGYDYLLAYEHVLGANPDRPGGWRGPYTYQHTFHEPMVLFGYLAGLTQTIEFATGILILPQRQTVLAAKQAAEVDVLSGGRLRLGIGIGWNKVEYDGLGYDFHRRGRRVEEQVDLMRQLWTAPLVTFDGEFDSVDDAGIKPLPVQRPIPIWFGGGADPVLRRMARMGDGWMPNSMPMDQAQELTDTLRGYLAECGRTDFGIDVRLNAAQTPQSEWLDYIAGWQPLGATHVYINTMAMGYNKADQHIAELRRFKDTIGF